MVYTWLECKGDKPLPDNTIAVKTRNGEIWCRTTISDWDNDCTHQGLNSDIVEYLVCDKDWFNIVMHCQQEHGKMLNLTHYSRV